MGKGIGVPLIGYQEREVDVVGRNRMKNLNEAQLRKQALFDKVRKIEASRKPVKWYVKLWNWITRRNGK